MPDVATISNEQARASLQRLVAAEMLYEKLDIRRNEFAFRHPLVQEAAYGSLLSEQRRRLHRGAAAALAVQFRERLDEYSSLIAHHWELGGDALQAAGSYVKSAIWIGARDPRQALETWRAVRRLLQEQPSTPPVDYMLMMACGNVVSYAWWQASTRRSRAGLQAGDRPRPQTQGHAGAALPRWGSAGFSSRRLGRRLCRQGRGSPEVQPDPATPSVAAVLKAVHSHALLTAGLLPQALDANALALACVDQIEVPDRQMLGFDPRQWLKAQQARILMLLGRQAQADVILDDLLEAPAIDTVHLVNALGTKVESARRNGTSPVKDAERLVAALKGNETPYLKVLGNRYKAIALLADGAAQEAVDLLSRTIEYARVQKAGLEVEPYLLASLAEGLMLVGSADARTVAIEARDFAQRRAMRVAAAEASALLKAIGSRG